MSTALQLPAKSSNINLSVDEFWSLNTIREKALDVAILGVSKSKNNVPSFVFRIFCSPLGILQKSSVLVTAEPLVGI